MLLLEEYIMRQDSLALHSLLEYVSQLWYLMTSMLVQFARDLGEDLYRKYWERTITLLSQTVNHADFEVIEVSKISWHS